MSTIKRYDPVEFGYTGAQMTGSVHESPDGEYALFSDHEELLEKYRMVCQEAANALDAHQQNVMGGRSYYVVGTVTALMSLRNIGIEPDPPYELNKVKP